MCIRDRGSTDITAIVDKIRADLELDKAWFEKCNNIPNAFNYMRGLLEENGIVVMMNGVVNKNTHRALNVEEFRAFTLVNEWAPLKMCIRDRAYILTKFHQAYRL